MTQLRFNPWSDFDQLHNQMERLLDQRAAVAAHNATFTPAVDVYETEAAYAIDLDLPGVQRESVTIEVMDGVLHVRGERARRDLEGGSFHRTERRFGSFERGFQLPKNVEGVEITARSVDGVLSITLPKKPEAQPLKIEVQA